MDDIVGAIDVFQVEAAISQVEVRLPVRSRRIRPDVIGQTVDRRTERKGMVDDPSAASANEQAEMAVDRGEFRDHGAVAAILDGAGAEEGLFLGEDREGETKRSSTRVVFIGSLPGKTATGNH